MKKALFIIFSLLFIITPNLFPQGISNNSAIITVGSGAYLTISGANGHYTNSGTGIINIDGTISISGNWTNNGSTDAISTDATPEGTVTFSGSATQDIGGTGKTVFENLTINNTNGVRLTSNNNTVSGILTLTNGAMNLNSNTFVVSNGATNAIQRTNGYFLSNALDKDFNSKVQWNIGTVTGNHIYPFGTETAYIPISFNPSGGNSGNVTVSTYPSGGTDATTVYNNRPTLVANLYGTTTSNINPANQNGANIIRRFYYISPSSNPTSATVSLVYADAEVPVNGEDASMWQQRYNESINEWENLSTTNQTSDVITNTITQTNITSFTNMRIFGIARNSNPLPIQLVKFLATCNRNLIEIMWITATETNNEKFILQKSNDGIHWFDLKTLQGAGNSTQYHSYKVIDMNDFDNLVYYRLKQIDIDGFEYISEPISKSCPATDSDIYLYFNQQYANPSLEILFNAVNNEKFILCLYDMLGNLIIKADYLALSNGKQAISIPLPPLSQGIYLFSLYSTSQVISKKVLLK